MCSTMMLDLSGRTITIVTQVAVAIGFLRYYLTAVMALFVRQVPEKLNNVHHVLTTPFE
ncbi:hypothetical protein GCM10028778_14300 [Barrientosiimonas marina]